jgi:hypothetical protein
MVVVEGVVCGRVRQVRWKVGLLPVVFGRCDVGLVRIDVGGFLLCWSR